MKIADTSFKQGKKLNSFLAIDLEPEVYSEPYQASKMELFARIVTSFQPLIIFEKSSILDIWWRSEYASYNIPHF